MIIFASQQSSHSAIPTVLLDILEKLTSGDQRIRKVYKISKVIAVIARVMEPSAIDHVRPVVIIVEAVPIR